VVHLHWPAQTIEYTGHITRPELRTLGTILLSLRSLGKKNLCLAGFANTADIVSMSFLNVHPSLPPQHLISKINPIIQAGAPALTGSKSN
jgi:hypothetical protein